MKSLSPNAFAFILLFVAAIAADASAKAESYRYELTFGSGYKAEGFFGLKPTAPLHFTEKPPRLSSHGDGDPWDAINLDAPGYSTQFLDFQSMLVSRYGTPLEEAVNVAAGICNDPFVYLGFNRSAGISISALDFSTVRADHDSYYYVSNGVSIAGVAVPFGSTTYNLCRWTQSTSGFEYIGSATTVFVAAVPEIDPSFSGSVLAILLGSLGLMERRRMKAA
jgi:hypothetical protein